MDRNEKRNLETLEELKKGKNIRVRRFKKHDRVYWETNDMRVVGTFGCKIEDIPTVPLRDFLIDYI